MQRIDNSDSEIHCEYMSICNNMEFLLLLQVLPKKLKLWVRNNTPTECGKKLSLSPNEMNLQCNPSFSCILYTLKIKHGYQKSSYIQYSEESNKFAI